MLLRKRSGGNDLIERCVYALVKTFLLMLFIPQHRMDLVIQMR
jgi:hypothetical protein